MSQSGSLGVDPLFVGLTRPPMIFGVSFKFVMLNVLTCLIAFINTNDLRILFLLLPCFHGIAYVICFKEPLFLELLMMRLQNFNRCRNRFYFGANSYDPY